MLLVAQAWCMGVSNTFLDAAATSLFLTHFAIERLPWVYIASAVTGVSLGFVIARLEARLAPAVLLGGTITMLVGSVAFMYAGVVRTDAPWLSVVLMMWKDVQYILSAMSLWAAAGMLFDLRQGKRLFGLIGAGDIMAIIAGGLAVPLVAEALGAPQLLAVAALAQGGCLATFAVTMRRFGRVDAASPPPEGPAIERRAARGGFGAMLRDPYLRPLFAISMLSYLGYYFVDYGFYARIQTMYPSAEAVASFYGYFLAATGVVNLLSNLFLSGRILTRFGVQAALLVLPAFVGAGVGLSLAGILLGLGTLLVWSTIATKLVDEVFRKSIEGPTYRVLYQPLRRGDRLRVQAIRESVVEPFAIGLSGVVLIVLTQVLHVPATSLVWGLAAIIVGWVAVARTLGAGYVTVLRAAIGRRKLSHADAGLDNETTRRLLREYLESASGAELVYALKVLESAGAPDLDRRLVAAIDHEDAIVREYAIDAVGRRRVAAAAAALRERMGGDPSARLRGQAAFAICAIEGAEAAGAVAALLDDPAMETRRGALGGLLAHGGPAGAALGGGALERFLASADPADRLVAAQALGQAYDPARHDALRALLDDSEPAVARAATLASGATNDSRFAIYLLVQLERPARRQAAAAALIALGDAAVPVLSTVLAETAAARPVRRQAARILGRIGSARAVQVLVDAMETPDVVQRGAVSGALEHARWKATGPHRARVAAMLEREAAEAAGLYALIEACTEPALGTFRDALLRETIAARGRILSLVTLLIGEQAARDARTALASEVPERRSQGLEMIETLLPRPLRRTIIPLLDELPGSDRVRRLVRLIGSNPPTVWERIEGIVAGSGEDGRVWLRAVAIRTAALHRPGHGRDDIARSRGDRERLIRETAAWAGDYMATSHTNE